MMAGAHGQDCSGGSSLDDYDKFFDAQTTLEETQRDASSNRLPTLGEEAPVPTPYDREQPQLDFNAHHSAVYYPHAHQTLRNSESRRRKKKRKDRTYKKRQGSRPSQLFQPSLQEVAEQRSTCSTSTSSSSEHGLWFLPEAISETDEHREHEGEDGALLEGIDAVHPPPEVDESNHTEAFGVNNSSTGHSKKSLESGLGAPQGPTAGHSDPSDSSSQSSLHADLPATSSPSTNNVKFMLGDITDQESVDGGMVLVVPKLAALALQPTNSAPTRLACQSSADSQQSVKFLIGDGSGSQSNILDEEFAPSGAAAAEQEAKSEHVTFTLGGESSDNFQKRPTELTAQHRPTEAEAARQRSHSSEEEPANFRKYQVSAMKSRSYSYHPGDDLAAIRCRGSDVELSDLPNRMMTTITSPEEAALLGNHGLEDLATHRLEHHRAYSKHKINKSIAANMTTFEASEKTRVTSELTPHELFVELDELVSSSHEEAHLMEWKEKARWIKFEEDVLETSDRWGRPHVASLSFHSLIELRRLLENGVVQVDVEAHDYLSLMQAVVDELTIRRTIDTSQEEHVMQALILRHKHLSSKGGFSRSKSYSNLIGLDSMSRNARSAHFFRRNKTSTTVSRNPHAKSEGAANDHTVNIPEDETDNPLLTRNSKSYHAHLDQEKYNMELLKKIPANSEVASVLVGTLSKLKSPCTVLFRLRKGLLLDHVAEVPLPVRFLFVCVGPPIETVEYLEIGRSLATLLSNESFREVAYKAKEKTVILKAMNAFLDESIVLPPGDFDMQTLIPIMHMARKTLRKRKESKKPKMTIDKQSGEVDIAGGSKPPPSDPLSRTGRAFGGLVDDIKRKAPHYVSDIKDGLNPQVIAAFIFIYFACLSPAITFGGLLGEKTDNYMGASEMLLATAVTGVLFSLLGGQPLLITGFTGPNMVFEEGVYKFSKSFDIDFLVWRFWIGVWVFVISLILLATEASFLVKYVSRFTQEIFAFLISMIFLYEVLVKLIKVFKEHPLCEDYGDCLTQLIENTSTYPQPSIDSVLSSNMSSNVLGNITTMLPRNLTTSWIGTTTPMTEMQMQPNTALLTASLTLFTFVVAYALKGMRNKKLLGRTIRRALGDFGVPLSILIMCLIDYFVGDRVYTQKLAVPAKFSVTAPEKRGWLIHPLGGKSNSFPVGHIFSAILPAILASILIFMESLISGVIVDKKENKLRKGSGYNLDILVLGFAALINGVIGVPFLTAATVRSVSHISALTVMSKNYAPGERPKLERVVEQRVSNLLVHILIAISMFLGVVLSYIPTAVLFGVFLYMGIASLSGIQMFDRIVLLLTPTKHHPVDVCYVRHVRALKMHLFTVIQILAVAVLWAVKLSPGALAFPFVLLLLVPFRSLVMKFMFSAQELKELDGDGDCKVLDVADEGDLDFYETAHMPD